MTFGAVFPRVFRPAYGPGLASAAAGGVDWSTWFTYLWDAKNAASQAASYVDLIAAQTMTVTVAPTWAAGTGWTGTGTQYLKTGITAASGVSMMVRYSGVPLSGVQCAAGSSGSGNTRLLLHAYHGSFAAALYGQGGFVTVAPGLTGGVLAVSAQQGYRNGSAEGGAIAAWSGTGFEIYVLARNNSGTASEFLSGSVQAIGIKNGTISNVSAAYAAMAAL